MNSLIWFRNDLRVSDNASLSQACAKHDKVLAVFCFDPRQFEISKYGFKKTERYRAKFLIETIENLRLNLKKLNISLLVYYEKPELIIPELTHKYEIDTIYLQTEWTRDENKVLTAIKTKSNPSVNFVENCDQFLYHPEEVPFESFENIPDVFTFFRKKVEKFSDVGPILEKPNKKSSTNLLKEKTNIPTLKNLGFEDFQIDDRSAFPFQGGEDNALERLQIYFWKTQNLATYKKTRNGLIGENYSSKFSPWLANGAISPKAIYWAIKDFENNVVKNQDTYWLIFELIWRDFFKYVSLKYKDKIFHLRGVLDREYCWGTSQKKLQEWITGQTSEPFVNANMIELARTGWMSNRGRQNVASYWAKELKQDWRIGATYFESFLLDYDVHSNWCNWMYLSGVGNDPRDRKFNIKRQAEIYDPENTFQKLWL